jgi:hypothetical protein
VHRSFSRNTSGRIVGKMIRLGDRLIFLRNGAFLFSRTDSPGLSFSRLKGNSFPQDRDRLRMIVRAASTVMLDPPVVLERFSPRTTISHKPGTLKELKKLQKRKLGKSNLENSAVW